MKLRRLAPLAPIGALLLVVLASAAKADNGPVVGPVDDGNTLNTVIGKMAIDPKAGIFETPITFTTAGGCPRGTNTITRMYGPKLPALGENVIGNTETRLFGSPPGPRIVAPMTIDINEVIQRQPTKIQLNGVYRFLLTCQVPLPYNNLWKNYGVYEAKMRITDGKWTALTTLADLPKTPFPTPGPDALASLSSPTPAPDPRSADEKYLPGSQTPIPPDNFDGGGPTKSAAGGGNNHGAIALGTAGVVVLAGLGPLAFRALRRKTPAGAK